MRMPALAAGALFAAVSTATVHNTWLVPNAFAVTRGETSAASDSQDVADAVARFHSALAAGDSLAALAELADDVTILESGSVESRSEYRSHHLPGDMAFARAIPSRRSGIHVRVQGGVAWVTSTSVTEGEFRGRPVNSTGAELAVLSRESGGWRIRAIHWSSRARR